MKVVRYYKSYIHLSKKFNSGHIVLDSFIKSEKSTDSAYGVTYIWLNESEDEIIGYYCISAGTFDYKENETRIKQCGAAHIDYFAIDEKYQGVKYEDDKYEYKLSDLLLLDCLNRINVIRHCIGIGCVTLSSTEQGYNLYKRADFEETDLDTCFSDTEGEKKTTDMYLFLDQE